MEAEQQEVRTRFTRYIFLDVVQFTHNRSVEAQSHIVEQLNKIVRDAIAKYELTANDCIFLPTGDGICIGLINPEIPYDAHLQLGLTILELLSEYNKKTDDRMRQFSVRIGINQNVDNVVVDINGNENLAGTGINTAARLMNAGEANQILVGQAVFDMLQQREKYMNKFVRRTHTVKHDLTLTSYQYVSAGHEGLNITLPAEKIPTTHSQRRLTPQVAYYFAHAIRNRQFILTHQGRMGEKAEAMVILLRFLAEDSLGESQAPETRPYSPITYGAGEKSLKEQLEYYDSQDFRLISEFSERITNELGDYLSLLSIGASAMHSYFVKPEGIEKLKKEFPEIWEKFELSKYV